jgi:hypothetical protein
MNDYNLNNITKKKIKKLNIIKLKEKKLTILEKLNIYFTQQKYLFFKFNEITLEFTLNWIPFTKIVDEFK